MMRDYDYMCIDEIISDMEVRPYIKNNEKITIIRYLRKIEPLQSSKKELEIKLNKQIETSKKLTHDFDDINKFYKIAKLELADTLAKNFKLSNDIDVMKTKINILEEENEKLKNFIFESKKSQLIEETIEKIDSNKELFVKEIIDEFCNFKKRKFCGSYI